MPDNLGFYDTMTAFENLMYIGELNGIPRPEVAGRAREMMNLVGLKKEDIHKKTAAYSRGMKQRLGLADVLIKQPEVIILDELDPGHRPERCTGVFDTHSEIELPARAYCFAFVSSPASGSASSDRVGVFVSGKLVVEGNVGTLSRNLFDGRSYEVQVSVSNELGKSWKDAAQLLELRYVEKVAVTGQRITILCSKDVTPDLVRFFVAKEYDVMAVHRKEYDLDDIYQKYFETDLNESSQ